jgi:preprotein translocase subunit SecB
MTEENNQAQGGSEPQFKILRIYLKDVSFETPNSPEVFTQDWKPDVNLQLNTVVNSLDNDVYEVVLKITVTATQGEKTGYLAEVDQAGLFAIKNFEDAQKGHTLGAFCPHTLFPFAREAIANLVVKGGFPQLLLSPINFDALYAQQVDQVKAQVADAEPGAQ